MREDAANLTLVSIPILAPTYVIQSIAELKVPSVGLSEVYSIE